MSITKREADHVAKIAAEVIVLAKAVSDHLDGKSHYEYAPGMMTGALKRRSMDLTRALAVMRGAN